MINRNTKFTIMFIKPDAVRDDLAEQILNDFLEAGMTPLFCKQLELNVDQATMIYRDHVDNSNFRFAIGSLIEEGDCKTSVLVLLKKDGDNALLTAQEIKGRADKNGIRAKYRRYLWTELQEKGISGDELSTMLSRNRVHIPDSDDHTCEILKELLDESEVKSIEKLEPEFGEFLEGRVFRGIEQDRGFGGKERL